MRRGGRPSSKGFPGKVSNVKRRRPTELYASKSWMDVDRGLYLENLPGQVAGSEGDKLKHLGKEVAEEYRRLQTHLETQMLRYFQDIYCSRYLTMKATWCLLPLDQQL